MDKITHRWYTRPVFFVSDVNRALQFYIHVLGFEKKWHEADGAGGVCQIERAGCEIILCQDDTRTDKSRVYVELTSDGLAELRREIAERLIPSEPSWWGTDVIRIADPDGNELLVPAEHSKTECQDETQLLGSTKMTSAWVFNGAPLKRFAGGIFSRKELADEWIQRHRLTGVLTLYPVDVGAFDRALETGLFTPRKPHESSPEFIGGFTSAGMEHYHYEDGSQCSF